MNQHPPDRSQFLTEQRNPHTMNLHQLSVEDCVAIIQQEDRHILNALEKARPMVVAFIEDLVPRFSKGGRLIYIGAGTSGRLGVLDASEAPPTFQLEQGRIVGLIAGGDSSLRKSSEGLEDDFNGAVSALEELVITHNDSVLGIASGGTTPYVLGALSYASGLIPRPLTGLISCTQVPYDPTINHLILIETGPEVLTGSTRMKAGTATKMVLNTISTTLMIQTGRVYENLMVDLRATNNKLKDRAARIVQMISGVSRDEAFMAIEKANGSVKIAIVMLRNGVDYVEAVEKLDSQEGRLDKVFQEVK